MRIALRLLRSKQKHGVFFPKKRRAFVLGLDWKDLICDNAPKDPTDELHACGLRRVEFRGISLPLPRTNRKITDNGWYGPDHPSTATVEWGTEMLNTTADFLVDFMRAFEKIPLDAE